MARLLLLLLLLAVLTPELRLKADAGGHCLRVEERIANIRLKLRLGYSAREGRVLREKLRTLQAERQRACRGGRRGALRAERGPAPRANLTRSTPTRDLWPDRNSGRRA